MSRERLQVKYALSTYVNKSRLCPDHTRACHEPRSVNLISVPSLGTDGSSFQAIICALSPVWDAFFITYPHPGAHVPCPVLGSVVTFSRKPSLIPSPWVSLVECPPPHCAHPISSTSNTLHSHCCFASGYLSPLSPFTQPFQRPTGWIHFFISKPQPLPQS